MTVGAALISINIHIGSELEKIQYQHNIETHQVNRTILLLGRGYCYILY